MIDDDAALIWKCPSADTDARRDPLAEATPHSVVTDTGSDARGKVKNTSAVGTERASDAKPKGDHNAFTHFREGSEL